MPSQIYKGPQCQSLVEVNLRTEHEHDVTVVKVSLGSLPPDKELWLEVLKICLVGNMVEEIINELPKHSPGLAQQIVRKLQLSPKLWWIDYNKVVRG